MGEVGVGMTHDELNGALGRGVSRETWSRLCAFVDEDDQWKRAINLVGRATLAELWTRHVLDSAQLFWLPAPGWKIWLDIGSGGGFPGVVIACMSGENGGRVVLVESDGRKAAFLSEVCRSLKLPAQVVCDRIERSDRIAADVVSARALGRLPELIQFAEPHLAADGDMLFLKGRQWFDEICEVDTTRYSCVAHPSLTGPDGRVISVRRRGP